ncbi:MAG: hypothetical protein HOQ24_05785 [Mycobacteriaceae bacterium]|nr:hypothetical protein [Mycobacteriaceae bacterium]
MSIRINRARMAAVVAGVTAGVTMAVGMAAPATADPETFKIGEPCSQSAGWYYQDSTMIVNCVNGVYTVMHTPN